MTSKSDKFEEAVEKAAKDFEFASFEWVKNDRFFDGFRNTYARALINVLTWITLFGYGAYAFITPGAVNWYCGALIVLAIVNQLSVRFVFNVSNEHIVADEYQAKRRDAAYRKAYRRVSHQLIAGLILFFSVRYFWGDQSELTWNLPGLAQVELFIRLSLEQTIVLSAFYIGLFGLQKYMSWGVKGEPWLSKNEQP